MEKDARGRGGAISHMAAGGRLSATGAPGKEGGREPRVSAGGGFRQTKRRAGVWEAQRAAGRREGSSGKAVGSKVRAGVGGVRGADRVPTEVAPFWEDIGSSLGTRHPLPKHYPSPLRVPFLFLLAEVGPQLRSLCYVGGPA